MSAKSKQQFGLAAQHIVANPHEYRFSELKDATTYLRCCYFRGLGLGARHLRIRRLEQRLERAIGGVLQATPAGTEKKTSWDTPRSSPR
jgi:hypothetical protein